MNELAAADFERVAPLFDPLSEHLAVRAALQGSAPAQVYVDDVSAPQAALINIRRRRFYLAGRASTSFARSLGRLFTEVIYPEARTAGDEALTLYIPGGAWETHIAAILPDKAPIATPRQSYVFRQDRQAPRAVLPPGYLLCEVDAGFLAEPRANREALLDELCSERPSAVDFLARSFGLCPVASDGREIAGWCLSEYNVADCCEVGIATLAPHQRLGLATAAGLAFVALARDRGIRRIGWHCFAANRPSVATALKIGFELHSECTAYMAWYDEATNLAANGNSCLWRGEYVEATAWFEAAWARGADQGWTYWGAACAAAMQGRRDVALDRLRQAMERGYNDLEWIRQAPEWDALVGSP
jgi:GNAT superfamily N-acetyltransferase